MADLVNSYDVCLNNAVKLNNTRAHFIQKLRIYYVNIVSLKGNFSSLENHLLSFAESFDVVILGEIRKSNFYSVSGLLNGYNFVNQLPLKQVFGGIGIFIKNNLKFKVRNDLNFTSNEYESLFLEISNFNKNWIIGGVYRHPNTNWKSYQNDFFNVCSTVKKENKSFFLAGDINLDLLKSNKIVNDFKFDLQLANVAQIVNTPTRQTTHSSTLIDHIYLFEPLNLNHEVLVVPNSFSDHSSITFTLNNQKFILNEKQYTRYFSKHNMCKFSAALQLFLNNFCFKRENFSEIQIEKQWHNFISQMIVLFNECFPLQKISKSRQKDKEWISPEIKKMCKKKEILFRKYKSNPSEYRKKVYSDYKTMLNIKIYESKRNYYEKYLNTDQNNKKLWKHINSLKNGCTKTEIPEIEFKDQIINEPKIISETFNNYFNSIGHNISQNCTLQSFKSYLPKKNFAFIKFNSISFEEILDKIDSLKNQLSSGPDVISNKIIKENKLIFSKILSFLISISLQKGYYPSCLKLSKIIPIHKTGSKVKIENYRPISLQCSFGKIFERVIHDKITKHLEENSILSRTQHGFKKFHSCQTAVAVVHDSILTKLHSKEIVIGIFLDLSKAFDTLNHSILIEKLNHYGFQGKELNLLKSYIIDRRHYTEVNNKKSETLISKCGVPQGSVLGPLLYNLFCNDLVAISDSNCKITQYADDTCFIVSSKSLDHIKELINIICSKIQTWFNSNCLVINNKKSNYMIFSKTPNTFKLKINNIDVEMSKSVNYLGIIIQNSLKWDETIDKKIKALLKLKYLFQILSKYIDRQKLLLMYKSLILSKIAYGIELYGNANKVQINKLQRLQNWFLKLILKKPKLYSTLNLHKDANILLLTDFIDFRKCVFMFDLQHSYVKNEYTSIINMRHQSSVSNYNTRSKNDIFLEKYSLYKNKMLFTQCALSWNRLSTSLKIISCRKLFKQELFNQKLSLY